MIVYSLHLGELKYGKREITTEFITELIDVLEEVENKAITDGEKELMYRIISLVNEDVVFDN